MWTCPDGEDVVGHLDCTVGVSEDSLLAACVDILASDDADAVSILGRIQTDVRSIFKAWDDTCTIKLERNSPIECPTVVFVLPESAKKLALSWKEIHEALRSDEATRRLPQWSMTTCLTLLRRYMQLEATARKVEETVIRFPLVSIVKVIGISLCVCSLGLQETTYTPLPYVSRSQKTSLGRLEKFLLDKLVVGMAVSATSNLDGRDSGEGVQFFLTPLGVLCMQVILGCKYPRQRTASLVVSKIGTGRGHDTPEVTLAIGSKCDNDDVPEMPKKQYTKDISYESDLWNEDSVTILETNIDDSTAENMAFVVELLLQRGALDAWITPIVMKKGRSAHTLHCLCRSNDQQSQGKVKEIIEVMFRNTTTLGIRIQDIQRVKLDRSFTTAQTPFVDTKRKGLVGVKLAKFKTGELRSMKPEFDHCREISLEANVPIQTVSETAIDVVKREQGDENITQAAKKIN